METKKQIENEIGKLGNEIEKLKEKLKIELTEIKEVFKTEANKLKNLPNKPESPRTREKHRILDEAHEKLEESCKKYVDKVNQTNNQNKEKFLQLLNLIYNEF